MGIPKLKDGYISFYCRLLPIRGYPLHSAQKVHNRNVEDTLLLNQTVWMFDDSLGVWKRQPPPPDWWIFF